jgi:hypothetical protein
VSAVANCPRCAGSVLAERFTDRSGRGVLSTCLACGDEREVLDEATVMTLAVMRAVARVNAQRQGGAE